jgi:serine/threonine-protein kinase HipA
MNHCQSCLKDIKTEKHFCLNCSKVLFEGNRKITPVLSFNKQEYVAIKRELSGSFSISGVQDKISLIIADDRLVPAKKGGTFILKPIPALEIPQYQNDVPANEHLTMQLASQVFKIKTAHNCLVYFSDNEPTYLTKRFDVIDEEKIHQEDFCQLLNITEDTHGRNYKYDASYQQAATVIKRFCSAHKIELEKYYYLLLFNYLFSNGDAHLKNFSLQQTPFKDYILAPAYDLVSTSVHFPNEARTALDLFTNFESKSFKANAFYTMTDFLKLAEFFSIKTKRAESFISRFFEKEEQVISLINRSFLSREAKERYLYLRKDRLKALSY